VAEYGVVLVTVDTEERARAIAETLVSERLVACVNLFPVQSIYTWQGEVQQETEWQLLLKTDLNRFADLEAKLQEMHPYEVPEILALPILRGSLAYLNWVGAQVAAIEGDETGA